MSAVIPRDAAGRHLLGHIPDRPLNGRSLHTGAHFGGLLYGTAAPAERHGFYPAVLATLGYRTQQTQSCTGYASDGAIETKLALLGTPCARRSPVSAYDFGRLLAARAAFPGETPTLTDDGAIPEYVIQGLSDCGIARLEDRADDPATINSPPSLEEIEQAIEFEVLGVSRIDPAAQDLELQVQLAICADIPVFACRMIDNAADHYTGGILGPPQGALFGGHAEFICEYDAPAAWYRTAGSWGQGYGEDGSTRHSPAGLRAMTDFYLINARRK